MSTDAVVITGASGGIGQALCRVFAGAGDHVIGVDREPPAANVHCSILAELRRFSADPAARAETLRAIRVGLAGKRLKAIVNNAAVQIVKPADELEDKDWQDTLDVNLLAPCYLVRGLLDLLEQAQGSVVNIGSVHGRLTKPGFAAYATSKAALEGLTRSLAVDLGGRVRVNCLAPAAVATSMLEAGFKGNPGGLRELGEMHPAGRIAQAEEVAQAAAFLASDKAAFITGTVLAIDGAIGARLHDPS